MSKKENWSVLKYLGVDTNNLFELKKGQYYYWPCSIENLVYEGVIDDEEYTSYVYPTDSESWEIAENPTGMAHRTIFEDQNSMSTIQHADMISQVKELFDGE